MKAVSLFMICLVVLAAICSLSVASYCTEEDIDNFESCDQREPHSIESCDQREPHSIGPTFM